jgi:hypothetical protein
LLIRPGYTSLLKNKLNGPRRYYYKDCRQ